MTRSDLMTDHFNPLRRTTLYTLNHSELQSVTTGRDRLEKFHVNFNFLFAWRQ